MTLFKTPSPRAAAALILVALAAGFAWIRFAGPRPLAWYPRCPFLLLTGWLCPGCGSTRTLHALAHGHFAEATGYNLLLVLALPILAAWLCAALWRGLAHNQPPPLAPFSWPHAASVTLVLVLVFTVARNLPWWPFCLLAPHP